MLRLLGAVLLMGGAAALGFSAAAHLRIRVICLRSLLTSLEQMERELRFCLSPLPVLFGNLARLSGAPAKHFYQLCSREMKQLGEKPISELWRNALEKASLPLEEDELGVMAELGAVLGRYDAAGQQEALDLARGRLVAFLNRAEDEKNRLSRVYEALGLSAGAFLLLILL